MKTIKFNDFLNEQLSDNSFNEGYQAEKAILESAVAVANARSKAGLTQRQLSELSHVPQSTIARIERGHNTSIETMSKFVYNFDEGNKDMRALLGGKGANLAEMTIIKT